MLKRAIDTSTGLYEESKDRRKPSLAIHPYIRDQVRSGSSSEASTNT